MRWDAMMRTRDSKNARDIQPRVAIVGNSYSFHFVSIKHARTVEVVVERP
jgi:hypothetical protein